MNREFLNPVASVIAQNMEKYADKTAVKIKGEEISYAVLDKIANDIFDKLTNAINQDQDSSNHAFSHDIKVGVYLPRDRYLIPAIWAIIKAGYTYVPLDTETPIERLKFIVKDCGVTVVLCENYFIGILDDVLTVDVLSTPNYIQKGKAISEKVNEIAYVIYTSGTTGKPKGVPISYYSLSNLLQVVSLPENFNISEKAIILCFASINFDASILDIMASLYYGATIILADEAQRRDIKQLYHLIEKENVTIATFPPSLVTLMPDFDFQAMDTLVVAGEKMLPSIIRKVSSAHYRLINAYGPTENTVMSTMREITSEMACENIGKTIPGVVGHVFRSDLTSVEVGEIGELCLGGIQLTSGYLHRPELNQEKFIKNPFDDKSEAPVLYKTGDLVRLMEDGSYDFIGRKDTQVKFNGYRIELEEIAKAIEQCAGVVQACVLVESRNVSESLVAYVKFADGTESNKFEKIKKQIKLHLPYYMVPSSWIEVEEFPRNINGKIDRIQLSAIKDLQQVEIPVSENTHEEAITISVIAHIIGIESIDIDVDLFDDLGMTSIQAMQIPIELEMFGIYISVDDIYRNRTIRKIVKNHSAQLSYWFNEPRPEKPVLVVVSGYTSFAFLYTELCKSLSDIYSIFVFESYHEYPENLANSCDSLVQYYLQTLSSISKKYNIEVITGFCLGGELGLLLAHEFSKQSLFLPQVVVLDGEVERSKVLEENIPIYFDFLSDAINRYRFNRDMSLIRSMPDFCYEGKVTSILADHFMSNLNPKSCSIEHTELQKKCARIFYDRAPGMWKKHYPNCDLFYVKADHWSYLHTPESIEPIVDYFRSLITSAI